ncbi:hypothetical protein B0H19DRAFT_1295298 [Mycena capillaripes]|nr:hypothetical protein B0H19DRAFT_1295298 [Mycena capillaripes]
MKPFTTFILPLFSAAFPCSSTAQKRSTCRNVPGSPGYPNPATWNALNETLSGRLINVVPSAKYCTSLLGGACTDAQWASAVFRNTIPGAMNQLNWEQGYDLTPPSLCLRNASTCGQGDVPLYSVDAETVADIQTAVKFACAHNLRVVIKSSGHDYLGRSTAPNSLLILTSGFQNISFTDSFFVGVNSQTLYQAAKLNQKTVVTGSAATVCTAGGYAQGGGHSALSPMFGLGSDNALEFHVVVASGELLKVNSISHSELFYALRGGGAGSWGVIISGTSRAYPTFNATLSVILLAASNDTTAGALAATHARHIFDLDSVGGSQYAYLVKSSVAASPSMALLTYLPNTTPEKGMALMAPFLNASRALPGATLLLQQYEYGDINDALFQADDSVGSNVVLGSRLIPEATYRSSPERVGQGYEQLLDILGGQVRKNAKISSAVTPAWRTAKTHVTSLDAIHAIRQNFQTRQLPILDNISGPNAGSYSNEADVLEAHFQTTFYCPNYARLTEIKNSYDPKDLFIVGAGVGSDRWDEWGMCRI